MAEEAPLSTSALKKRGKGRPSPGDNEVGRERLLVATEKLLHILPPARVTIPRVAREADVNPSLVYYYFGSRAALLLAVVDRVTSHAIHRDQRKENPAVALAENIARTVQLVRRAPFMNRLMIEELAQAGSDDAKARVRDMNLDLIDFYRELLAADGGDRLIDADPLYLFIAILGASDFLSSAEPLLRNVLPEDIDMETLAAGYQAFLIELFLHGLLKS